MIQLSRRLQAVADLLTASEVPAQTGISCVADVGTDHGYIPIYLIERKLCKKAIALDIRKGPLMRAAEHIREHQLEAYIQTRLSDGLAALQPREAEAIVIAGMGGATMQGILEAGRNRMASGTVLVLQPQSEVAEFRNYLKKQGFVLTAEDMVCEDGKFYPMMRVCYHPCTGMEEKEETGWELPILEQQSLAMEYGPLLLQQRHPVLKEFLLWQQGQRRKILENLKKHAETEAGSRRLSEIETELAVTARALQLYEEVEK